MMQFAPYLNFNGTCREAFAYYRTHLGGEIPMTLTYGETPGEPNPNFTDETRKLIAHTRLVIGDFAIMGSDNPPTMETSMANEVVTVCFYVPDAAEAERVFKALSDKGVVQMPLQQTFFAHRFGMTTDRFGVKWMVNCETAA
jgi:PhnB protein